MRTKSLPRFGIKIIVCYEDRRKPGFKVICSDSTKKYEVGFIDSDDSMEDVATLVCEMKND